MIKDLTVGLKCIVMRNGIELWLESSRVEVLQNILKNISNHKFIDFDGESINTADLVGVFKAETMEALTHRKNGDWQCRGGTWHIRGEKCTCPSLEEKKFAERRAKAIRDCGKCNNGWVNVESTGQRSTAMCECIRNLAP